MSASDDWQQALARVIVSEEDIARRVRELAADIRQDYDGLNPVLIGVLKGSIVFLSDLIRQLDMPLQIDLICASSYGEGTVSSGKVRLLQDLTTDLSRRHVLVIEDIVDTGATLAELVTIFRERGAASVQVCSLLSKQARRTVEVDLRYVGFDVPDEFVVGYGLDFAERYRNLPYVAALRPEACQ